jgi:membrane-bound lytic murein transglycosylase D
MRRHSSKLRLAGLLTAALSLVLVAGPASAQPALGFSPEFPVSAAMQERVRFWIRVFTEVSRTEAVLHDRDDLRLVYDVVRIGETESGGPVDAARASYDRILLSMALEGLFPRFGFPSAERRRVGALFARAGRGPQAYARAVGNIRAQRGLREIFADGLVRSALYLPTIRGIFAAARLPPELVYLPHVESSFNPNALSHAGAAGLWQFTRDTGDRHLKIAGAADERFDPVRSSVAAARHLARAREVLGSWPLAVAAYNHGVAGMVRARTAVGSDSLDDIVRGYESASFGFASRNFYAEFLAAAHVAQHAAYYFPELKRAPIRQYVVRPGDSLWKIAHRHRVSVRALIAANNLGRAPLQQGQRLIIHL